MLRNLKLDVFYPHPPERVWQAIANRRALAAWLMDNDFEPRLGQSHEDRSLAVYFSTALEVLPRTSQCSAYTAQRLGGVKTMSEYHD